MATTALSTMWQNLARAQGYYLSSSATSDGTSTTIVDTAIVREDTTIFPGLWVYIIDGTNAIDGESRRISSVSSSTITTASAFSAATTSGDTYLILPHDPNLYTNSITQAIRTLYPRLYLPLVDETLVVDNLISNPSFESALSGGAHPNWTSANHTAALNTSRVKHGTNSADITASGGLGTLSQNIWNSVEHDAVVGKTLHIRAHCWASTASAARLRITFDGTAYTNGPYHSGDAEWEGPNQQYINVSIPADATEIRVYLAVATGETAYWDLVTAWIGPVSRYTIPSSFIDGPHRLYQQADAQEPERGDYLPVGPGNPLRSGRVLRMEGMGRLTAPTTYTGTTEVDSSRAELIEAQASVYLYRTLQGLEPGSRDYYQGQEQKWLGYVAQLLSQPGIAMKPLSAHERNLFRVNDDSGTRRLLLSEVRG